MTARGQLLDYIITQSLAINDNLLISLIPSRASASKFGYSLKDDEAQYGKSCDFWKSDTTEARRWWKAEQAPRPAGCFLAWMVSGCVKMRQDVSRLSLFSLARRKDTFSEEEADDQTEPSASPQAKPVDWPSSARGGEMQTCKRVILNSLCNILLFILINWLYWCTAVIPIRLIFDLLRRFSVEAPDNDDADTEAPTEESDYDPFAGAQVSTRHLEWIRSICFLSYVSWSIRMKLYCRCWNFLPFRLWFDETYTDSWLFRFSLPQGKESQDYNPFAEAESAVGMEAIDLFRAVEKAVEKVKLRKVSDDCQCTCEDDGEDEGAFDSLIEMLRAAEREGNSVPSRPVWCRN